jgi:hypothetical protein
MVIGSPFAIGRRAMSQHRSKSWWLLWRRFRATAWLLLPVSASWRNAASMWTPS